VVVETWDH